MISGGQLQRRLPAFSGLTTYLQAPYIETQDELRRAKADIAVIGAPVDIGTTYRPGARFGPRAIRQASNISGRSSRIYHLALDVHPLDFLKVVDYGDANCPPQSLSKSHDAIRQTVKEALDAGAMPVVLGGDHSITLPVATAVAEKYGFGNVGIVHFDAHADTGESSYAGELLSHGTPMRRLIESGAVPGKNFVQVGLRGYWPPKATFDWMRSQGMRWHMMSEIEERGFDAVLADAVKQAHEGARHLYLSVDVDVVDPGAAPGTGTPEPGGISPAELLRAVRKVALTDRLVGADVVEVAPAYDGPGEVTAFLAHRVVLEIISAQAKVRETRPKASVRRPPGAKTRGTPTSRAKKPLR